LNEIRNYMGNYHVKSGVYHYHRNEFKQALGFLRKALADEASLSAGERRNARCYLALSLKGLAQKLAANGDPEAAVEELRNAAEVRSDFPDIHFQMAQLLERTDRSEEAVESYRRALECHPSYVDACVALAYCLVSVGRTQEAADSFERALEMKIERLRDPCTRGLELLRGGDRKSSMDQFHEVFLAVPRLADVYLEQALDYMRAEEFEKALIELDRALELNPNYPDLHNFRGLALCEVARPAEAVAAFRRAAELSPRQVVPRLNLAFAQIRAGCIEEAEIELESVLAAEPGEPVAMAKLEELRQADRRGPGVRPGSS